MFIGHRPVFSPAIRCCHALGTEAFPAISPATLPYLTFSCYHREPKLGELTSRATFESSLERVRQQYGLLVYGYVVNAGARAPAGQRTGARHTGAGLCAAHPFWQARYYDFNVWSEHKFVEKLRYIHRNPVQRGLVERPEEWAWSSFRHYANRDAGPVEIESYWTARRREQMGIFPTVRIRVPENTPAQAKLGRGTLQDKSHQ